MSINRATKLSYWLALSALFTPFIWIKIGPQGIAIYGPDVPDIYFLGAFVTGKDWTFPPIAYAIVFQLILILFFILCTVIAEGAALRVALRQLMAVTSLQIILLVLFPFWMAVYVELVIHNSDGAVADLRVYPHFGVITYLLLLALAINIFIKAGREIMHKHVLH